MIYFVVCLILRTLMAHFNGVCVPIMQTRVSNDGSQRTVQWLSNVKEHGTGLAGCYGNATRELCNNSAKWKYFKFILYLFFVMIHITYLLGCCGNVATMATRELSSNSAIFKYFKFALPHMSSVTLHIADLPRFYGNTATVIKSFKLDFYFLRRLVLDWYQNGRAWNFSTDVY